MRIIIEEDFPLEVQSNDHWEIPIGIDDLATLPDPIPVNSVFHFAVFDTKKNVIINRPNLTATLVSGENFITVSGVPEDTLAHANKCLFWELQARTPSNKYYTVAKGKFTIHKTFIANA
jgi:hypothetical protein